MDIASIIFLVIIVTIFAVVIGINVRNDFNKNKIRKKFLIAEIKTVLVSRTNILDAELRTYCTNIIRMLEEHTSFQTSFDYKYTYGKYNFAVKFYKYNNELTIIDQDSFNIIVRVSFPE